jgi:predicted Rossmann fold flavoprotein
MLLFASKAIMDQTSDIVIIGAGAAGLAAAIFAGETARAQGRSLRISLLDSAKKIGAKILISGGGRCNVTHDEVHPDDFHGSRNIVRNVLAAFNEKAAVRWFAALGVPLKREDTGKLFPMSDSARTVLEALQQRCAELGIVILTQHHVHEVAMSTLHDSSSSFQVRYAQGVLHTRRVIMATGGRSLPRTGSDGSGWEIVRRLGHTVTATHPALVPFVLQENAFHSQISGIALEVELSTFADGKLIDRRSGSLLWTHFGISGPVVMDASRHWITARATGKTAELRCHFFPGQSFDYVEEHLMRTATTRPRAFVSTVLSEYFPERFVLALCQWIKIDPSMTLSQLSRERRRTLVHALTDLPLPGARER